MYLQCSCFPVRDAPGGGTESFEDALVCFAGLEGRDTSFWGSITLFGPAVKA